MEDPADRRARSGRRGCRSLHKYRVCRSCPTMHPGSGRTMPEARTARSRRPRSRQGSRSSDHEGRRSARCPPSQQSSQTPLLDAPAVGVAGVLGAGEDVQFTPAAHGDLCRRRERMRGQVLFFQGLPAAAAAVPFRAVDGQQQTHRGGAGPAVHGSWVGGVPGGETADAPPRWDGQVVLVAHRLCGVVAGRLFGFLLQFLFPGGDPGHSSSGRRPANG